jgi:hypothetical protein
MHINVKKTGTLRVLRRRKARSSSGRHHSRQSRPFPSIFKNCRKFYSSLENDLATESEGGEGSGSQSAGPKTELQLTEEERRILNQLKVRDAEVRAHEAAHLAAAVQHANGAPTFEFETGPDGRQYATGGEVSIDSSPFPGDPAKQPFARHRQSK